jgi:hypothetical protein
MEHFFVFGSHLQNLIDKVIVVIKFEKHLLEQLDLKVEIHAGRAVKAD